MATPTLRVLVVDDDPDNLQTLAVMVGLWGHEVHVAGDGKTALALYEANSPQVVLFDLRMPGMSGLELAAMLAKKPGRRRPFLVAVTGYADRDNHHHAHEAGAHLLLAKPVKPEHLKALLDRFRSLLEEPQETS